MNKPNKHNAEQKGIGKTVHAGFICQQYKISHNRFLVLGVMTVTLFE